jgi:hypothetical protein
LRLYHFTAEHLIKPILASGLLDGKIPIFTPNGRLALFMGLCQWLTDNGDWDAQTWATKQLISYDRTACRLTIEIPHEEMGQLFRAYDFFKRLPQGPTQRLLTDWEGSERWYIFHGTIPPGWIRAVEKRPGEKTG